MRAVDRFTELNVRIFAAQPDGHYPVEVSVPGNEPPTCKLKPIPIGLTAGVNSRRLSKWFFEDPKLETTWAELRGRHGMRRIRLRIDANGPELHTLPWELLTEADVNGTPRLLSAGDLTPFSRYLAGGWEPGEPVREKPLRVLVAIANPDFEQSSYSLEPVNEEIEWHMLEEVLRDTKQAGLVSLDLLPFPCTLENLELSLRNGYHVLHFIGHGAYDEVKRRAVLFMADTQNRVAPVYEDEFADMVGRLLADSDARTGLRLVFLASCQTATRSDANAFAGFAPQLVRGNVPAVLAMQDKIQMDTARAFTRSFYRQLLEHGQVDLACNEARATLLTGHYYGVQTPVLFSRLPHNLLVEFPKVERRPAGSFGVGLSITLLVVVAVSLSLFWFLRQPKYAFHPAQSGETLIILTSFSGGSKDAEFDPMRILREPIQLQLQRLGMQQEKKIRLEEVTQPISTVREARELGTKYDATLVIWGEFDDVIGVRTYVEIMKDVPEPYAQQAGNLLPVASLVPSPEQATEIGRVPISCLTNDLPHQGEYLTALSMGILELTKSDLRSASDLFSQSLQAAASTADGQCAIRPQSAYYWRGVSYSLQEQYPQALADFNQSLAIQPDLLFALVQRGNANIAMGNPAASQQDYQAALKLLYPEDKTSQSALLGNLGLAHELQDQFDQAAGIYRQALNIDESRRDSGATGRDWLYLGNLALRNNDQKAASEYLNRSLDYYKNANDQRGQMIVVGNLGLVAYQQKDYEQALRLFNEALSTGRKIDDKNGEARQMIHIGQTYLTQGHLDKAQQNFENALALSKQTGSAYGQAMAYIGLGMTSQFSDLPTSRANLEAAVILLNNMNSPDAKTVQNVLDQFP